MTEQINIDKELYSAVVGPEKSAYYLSKFERFASTGSRASWNWPVFFISFFWLLYRKMWLWAVCYFLLPYPVFIVLSIVSAFTTPWVLTVGLVLYWVVIWFVLPIYANALYYRHVRAKVNLASQSFSTTEKSLVYLSATGGPSSVAAAIAGVVCGFYFIAVVGILAAISIPQYQEYVARATVIEAYFNAEPAMEKITQYYNEHQRMPASLADAGIAPELVGTGAVLSYGDDALIIRFTANPSLQDKTLLLVPYLESGEIRWDCTSNTLSPERLPEGCISPD